MSIVPDFIERLFVRRGKALGWQWIPDSHVLDAQLRPVPTAPPFAAGQDYVVVRLAEMYLRTVRTLWRDSYPVVHSFVSYGDVAAQRSVTTVAGPGQLQDLGTANLDRVTGLGYRLAGPLVYDGQDIELLAGLYAVPARDGAKPLIDTLSQLSGLAPALSQVTTIAGVLKNGVEGLLSLDKTELTVGVRAPLVAVGSAKGRPAQPGFIVGINGPQDDLAVDQLWIKEGRLFQGPNPLAARAYDAFDMMLFEVHRGPSRAMSWATLPALAAHSRAFDELLKTPPSDLVARINEAYRAFETTLRAVDELTAPDQSAIRAVVAGDLKRRVKQIQTGDLIEIRAVAGASVKIEVRGFSARELPELPPGLPLPERADGEPLLR